MTVHQFPLTPLCNDYYLFHREGMAFPYVRHVAERLCRGGGPVLTLPAVAAGRPAWFRVAHWSRTERLIALGRIPPEAVVE